MKHLVRIIIIALSSVASSSVAQIQSNIAMFTLNPTYYNPAATGMQESAFNVAINSRANWVALSSVTTTSTPFSAMVSLDKRFDEKHFGLSANVTNLNYARFNVTDITGNISYFVNLSHETKFSMGLKLGLNNVNVNKIVIEDGSDAEFKNIGNFILPKVGLGLHFKGENFWIGAASPDLISYNGTGILAASASTLKRMDFNVSGGYKLMLNSDLYFQPSLLSIFSPKQNTITNINLTLGKDTQYWAGVGYCHNASASLMGGITLSGRYNLAYAFGYNYGFNTPSTSHELMLTWDLEDVL